MVPDKDRRGEDVTVDGQTPSARAWQTERAVIATHARDTYLRACIRTDEEKRDTPRYLSTALMSRVEYR